MIDNREEFRIFQLKNKFCKEGKLLDYKEEIEQLIDRIVNSNCIISDCDTCEHSSISQPNDLKEKNHIRISFKYPQIRPIRLIWDVLHEFGHHLSGHPNGQEMSVPRERQAWDIGQGILNEHPRLKQEEKDYEEYRDICLEDYIELNSKYKEE